MTSVAEVRRALIGPGLWPGPRRQARWVGRGLRRSRAGPEDRFCEAVRNDLRVPLTLEGPTRTMRGVPAPGRCDIFTTSGALGAMVTAWSWCWRGAAAGYGGDRRRPVTGGAVRGSRRAVGLASEGRGESCRLATARPPGWTQAAYDGHPGRSFLSTARVRPDCCGRGGQARRAGGAPLKTSGEKVVTDT